MNGRIPSDRDRTGNTAFLLWGWALLLLVLLSAAPTAAQPAPRLVGSAFDPTTASVTIAPSKRDSSVAVRKLRWNDPDDDATGSPPALVQRVNLRAAGRRNPSVPVPAGHAARSPDIALDALVRSHPARAPPSA